jgi:glycosyltransferase involved in cell wall biosynthesis
VQAVHHFWDEIMPRVRAKRPKARLKIVGADPPASILKLRDHPGVEVTGYVDDIRPHIASATVAVCPIGVGVGIQNKLLEAMAMGKPVVATAKACGAVNVDNERELLVASNSETFAQGVLRLLEDETLRHRIGGNAVRYVRENHQWGALARRLEDVYKEASTVFTETRLAFAGPGG